MRLFTAVEIDASTREAIAAVQHALIRALGEAAGEFRFVAPEQMHLTLVFIGHVGEERTAAFIQTMTDGIPVAPFQLSFGTVGQFPPRKAARVLWLGVKDGGDRLADVARIVADRLEPLAVPRETRPFVPHLTLARRRQPPSGPQSGGIELQLAMTATIAVAGVSLFSSQLSPKGSRYTRLETAPLIGSR